MSAVKDLGMGIIMIRRPLAESLLNLNSYVISGEKTALLHTGPAGTWGTLKGMIPNVAVDYVLVPHFEMDECGAVQQIARETNAEVVASLVGARQVTGFGLAEKVRGVKDGDKLTLGNDRVLELIDIPSEVHLWNGVVVFDHLTRTLFSSDLLAQYGSNIGMEEEKVPLDAMIDLAKASIPHPAPFRDALDRLLKLPIERVAPMHGSIIRSNIQDLLKRVLTVEANVSLTELYVKYMGHQSPPPTMAPKNRNVS